MATKYEQMLLFEEPLDVKVIKACREMRDAYDRSRKSQFAKIGELNKKVRDLEERLDVIERGLCVKSKAVLHEPCEFFQLALP